MSIANYSDLQQAVKDWLQRGDLDSFAPDLIRLAETKIFADLMRLVIKPREMELEQTGVFSGGTLPIPSGYKAMRRFYIEFGGISYTLKYISPSKMGNINSSGSPYAAATSGGSPYFYTTKGANFEIKPTPSTTGQYVLEYYGTPDLLSATPTNWLLTNYPNVYLYASLLQAAPRIKDATRIAMWASAYADAINDVRTNARAERLGGGTLSMTITGAR